MPPKENINRESRENKTESTKTIYNYLFLANEIHIVLLGQVQV
jgi:hypothetical protein